MNGLQVGTWQQSSTRGYEFAYAPGWLEDEEARPLSLSMPLRRTKTPYRGALVEAWFENLLPDSREIRQRIQSRFHTASSHAFDLLAQIGRDCVGAVQLLPEGQAPDNVKAIEGIPLTDEDVAHILRVTPVVGSDSDADDFRISLAGAQEKTALLWHQGRWFRPTGVTPTTHIFKLPLGRVGNFGGDLSTSVENEWLCSRIVAAFGVPIAQTKIATFEDQKALVVERFDRRLSPDGAFWMRLPQEDICQALGAPPSMKYESDGGPGIPAVMNLLLGSSQAQRDRLSFLKAQLVFWLLCAIDGHSKNFSVAIEAHGRYRLTPLYDVLSAWPVIGHGAGKLALEKAKMAMAVSSTNRHYHWSEILPRHWLATAKTCGVDQSVMKGMFEDLLNQVPVVIEEILSILPAAFPQNVSEPILQGIKYGADRLDGLLG